MALLLPTGKYRSKALSNDGAGFKALLQWLDSAVAQGHASVHVCMEATGAYHEDLALWLHGHDVKVSVINPAQVKHFLSSELVRNKTDGGDAQGLARSPRCMSRSPGSPLRLRAHAAGLGGTAAHARDDAPG